MIATWPKIFRRRSSVAGKNGAASSLGTRDKASPSEERGVHVAARQRRPQTGRSRLGAGESGGGGGGRHGPRQACRQGGGVGGGRRRPIRASSTHDHSCSQITNEDEERSRIINKRDPQLPAIKDELLKELPFLFSLVLFSSQIFLDFDIIALLSLFDN